MMRMTNNESINWNKLVMLGFKCFSWIAENHNIELLNYENHIWNYSNSIDLSLLSKANLVKIKYSVDNNKGSCEGPFLGYPSPLAHPHYNLLVACPVGYRLIAIEKLLSLSPWFCMERHSPLLSISGGGGRFFGGENAIAFW